MTTLQELWLLQKFYNDRVKLDRQTQNEVFWTKEYLLGIVSEIDEILREVDWKEHRGPLPIGGEYDKFNLGVEFADLLKYVMSLWQIWGFTEDEMLEITEKKSSMLEQLYRQEHTVFPKGSKIAIVDMDGTIADYRKGFLIWLCKKKLIDKMPKDQRLSLFMDRDFGWDSEWYLDVKDQFEKLGGYGLIPEFQDGVDLVIDLEDTDWKIVVVTARPIKISRTWFDSMEWLTRHGIVPDVFVQEGDGRISRALRYKNLGHTVLAMEDNPKFIARLGGGGIQTLVRAAEYNRCVWPIPNIVRLENFNAFPR